MRSTPSSHGTRSRPTSSSSASTASSSRASRGASQRRSTCCSGTASESRSARRSSPPTRGASAAGSRSSSPPAPRRSRTRTTTAASAIFLPICDGWWDETDSLSRVAGLWRRHAEELTAAGIGTLATLARANPGEPPPGLNAEAFAKLQRQAELQLHRRETGELRYVLLQPQPEHGLTLLPDPSPGDLFFDLEGNPFWDEQGSLEYLWGILDTAGEYRALWADDHASERRALEQTVDLIHARLAEHPDLHVYHYAAYEITALRRLMGRYGTREAEVDDLLRRDVFVDLLKVVRGLAAARPELLERRPGWGTRAGGELLELEPLSTDDCVRMLDDLLTGGLSTELSELVVERAEGNPFFVEELLGVLIDRGLLARE
jgi:predicted RecB family nuclease